MTEQFKKQLEDLINANSIDTLCDKPDYELAEMVCNFLSLVKMADSRQQVMQLTQDLYVLKHTVIAWKTVEERIKESNTVPEDAMIKEED